MSENNTNDAYTHETALVTGATGFVGAHVARLLSQSGFKVRALARSGSSRKLLDGVPVQWCEGNICDSDSLRIAMDGCTAVFHCAADYRLWTPNPDEIYLTNVGGTKNILTVARQLGVRRTIYTSTVGVLGHPSCGGSGDEMTPTSLEEMVGHYKRSKYLAEKVAREAAEWGQDVVIVNPSTPIGPGDMKPTPTGKMIVDFLNGAMPAYVDTGLNLVAVEDVAIGHLLAFERGVSGQRYILGCRNMTLHAILEMLAEITGLPAPEIRIPYFVATAAAWVSTAVGLVRKAAPAITIESVRMAHVHMFFDGSKAIAELQMPQRSVRDALARSTRWFLDNGYVRNSRRAGIARDTLAYIDCQTDI